MPSSLNNIEKWKLRMSKTLIKVYINRKCHIMSFIITSKQIKNWWHWYTNMKVSDKLVKEGYLTIKETRLPSYIKYISIVFITIASKHQKHLHQ